MTEYAWMAWAKRQVGLKEVVGQKHSPVIIGWLKTLKSWVRDDETAWCGTFVAAAGNSAISGFQYTPPANFLGARNWLKFGYPTNPQYGAVLVFWRGSKAGWQGHVGFYVAEDDTHYHVLGGNQSNSVSVTRIAKNRLLGARWPGNVPQPQPPRPVYTKSKRPVSVNEA